MQTTVISTLLNNDKMESIQFETPSGSRANARHQRCYSTVLSVHRSNEVRWTRTDVQDTPKERTVVQQTNANARRDVKAC